MISTNILGRAVGINWIGVWSELHWEYDNIVCRLNIDMPISVKWFSACWFLLVLVVSMNISNDYVSIAKYCQPKFSLSFLQDQGGQFLCGLSTFLWSEKAHVRCRFFIAFSLCYIYIYTYALGAFHWLIYSPLIYLLVCFLFLFC